MDITLAKYKALGDVADMFGEEAVHHVKEYDQPERTFESDSWLHWYDLRVQMYINGKDEQWFMGVFESNLEISMDAEKQMDGFGIQKEDAGASASASEDIKEAEEEDPNSIASCSCMQSPGQKCTSCTS
jgi:hypothetical protein